MENPFEKLFGIDFKDHLEVKKSGNGSIMQAAEFAATHDGLCADCYKATKSKVA